MPRSEKGPDGLETGIRLGCGGMLGLVVFGPLFVRLALRTRSPLVGYVGVPLGVVVFAVLAYRWGDEFWRRVGDDELLGERTFSYRLWFLGAAIAGLVIWMWWRNRA